MAIVRLEALQALELAIEALIPGLDCFCVDQSPPSELECFPSVSLMPTRWTFEPEQALEARTLPGNVQVWNVGQHTSPVMISILATTLHERYVIEAKILDLFLSQRHPLTGIHRPGILVLPVNACPELGEWLASFELESDEWNNSSAFDRRYESRIMITAIIPALTIERPVYTIDELQLGLTPDMTRTFTPATFLASDVEVVSISEDGTITAVEAP